MKFTAVLKHGEKGCGNKPEKKKIRLVFPACTFNVGTKHRGDDVESNQHVDKPQVIIDWLLEEHSREIEPFEVFSFVDSPEEIECTPDYEWHYDFL